MAAMIDGLLDTPLLSEAISLMQVPSARLPVANLDTGSTQLFPHQQPSVLGEPVGQGRSASKQSRRNNAVRLAVAAAVAVAAGIVGYTVSVATGKRPPAELWLIALGAVFVVGGMVMGRAVRRYLAREREHLTGDISALLRGAQTRKALSLTLALQVDEVVAKCRLMDEKFLGLTMALMVKEYDSAVRFDDRQKALMNAIAILDKLGPKLSPWYVRHEKLVATGVSLVGIISGMATAAQSVAKLVKGTP